MSKFWADTVTKVWFTSLYFITCNFFPKLDLQVKQILNLQGAVVEKCFFPADLTSLFFCVIV